MVESIYCESCFHYIRNNSGIDTESSYPYEARGDKCRFNASNVGATENVSYILIHPTNDIEFSFDRVMPPFRLVTKTLCKQLSSQLGRSQLQSTRHSDRFNIIAQVFTMILLVRHIGWIMLFWLLAMVWSMGKITTLWKFLGEKDGVTGDISGWVAIKGISVALLQRLPIQLSKMF